MSSRTISRRRFIQGSIQGSVAVGLESKFGILGGLAAETRSDAARLSSDELTLKVLGDSKVGYGVGLLYKGQAFAGHDRSGEFSAVFQNEERSLQDQVNDFRATSWKGDSTHVLLEGQCRLERLNTTVFAKVEYEVVAPQVVRKKVRLRQDDMFMLFYHLSHRLEAVESPTKFWSFDQLDWKGGPLHEYFPAAGYRTKNGLCVGFLTDSGFRNQWTRLIRRDGRPVKPAPRRIPDANLFSDRVPRSDPETISSCSRRLDKSWNKMTHNPRRFCHCRLSRPGRKRAMPSSRRPMGSPRYRRKARTMA